MKGHPVRPNPESPQATRPAETKGKCKALEMKKASGPKQPNIPVALSKRPSSHLISECICPNQPDEDEMRN